MPNTWGGSWGTSWAASWDIRAAVGEPEFHPGEGGDNMWDRGDRFEKRRKEKKDLRDQLEALYEGDVVKAKKARAPQVQRALKALAAAPEATELPPAYDFEVAQQVAREDKEVQRLAAKVRRDEEMLITVMTSYYAYKRWEADEMRVLETERKRRARDEADIEAILLLM